MEPKTSSDSDYIFIRDAANNSFFSHTLSPTEASTTATKIFDQFLAAHQNDPNIARQAANKVIENTKKYNEQRTFSKRGKNTILVAEKIIDLCASKSSQGSAVSTKKHFAGEQEEDVPVRLSPSPMRLSPPSSLIHGDTFIKGSELEGGNLFENVDFLLQYIQEKIPFENNEQIIKLLKNLQSDSKLYPVFNPADPEAHSRFQSNAEKYSLICSENVQNLKIGGKLILHGGWRDLGGGHALLYLIEKTENGKYAFTVINTGSGIGQFHRSIQDDSSFKTKYKPIFRLSDIDTNEIANPHFFLELLNLGIPTRKDGSDCNHDADELYKAILPSLKGKRDQEYENQVDFITDQRSGTCSWKSLMKLLSLESKDVKTYKNFIFDLRFDTLNNDYNKFLHETPKDTDIQLLKRSAENFGRLSLKQKKHKIITHEKFEKANELIQAIKVMVETYESQLTKETTQLDQKTSAPFTQPIADLSISKISKPKTEAVQNKTNLNITKISLETPPKDLEEFSKKLDYLIDNSRQLRETRSYEAIVNQITSFITSLEGIELEPNGLFDRLYQRADPRAIEASMEKIYRVNQLLVQAIASLPRNERGTPAHYAAQTILMAINQIVSDNLSREDNPLKGSFSLGNEERYLKGLFTLFEAAISDPPLRSLFNKAQDFFKNKTLQFNYETLTSLNFRLSFDDKGRLIGNQALQTILASSNFIKTVLEQRPDLKGANQRALLIHAFFLWGKENCPLPKSYQILFQQSVLSSYFVSNPHLNEIENSQEEPGNATFSNMFFEGFQAVSYDINLTGIPTYQTEWEMFKSAPHFKENTSVKHPGISSLIQSYNKEYYGQFKYGISWDKGSDIASIMNQKAGLSRQETQELALILSNRKLLIPNLIGYFTEHGDKFLKREYQIFFYLALFSGNHLEKAIKENPELIPKISALLSNQKELQKAIGNIEPQLFFLWMEEIITGIASTDKLPSIQLELEQFIPSIQDNTFAGKKTKALAYQQWIATFHNRQEITEEECGQLCKAYCYVNAFGFDPESSHPDIIRNMHKTMSNVMPGMEKYRHKKALARDIAKEVLDVNTGPENWKKTGQEIAQLGHGPYRIDLQTCTLHKGKEIIGGLPHSISTDPHFQELFGDMAIIATSPNPGVYEFSHQSSQNLEKSNYRLFLSEETGALTIQKMAFGKNWFTFVPESSLQWTFHPQGMNKGHVHWIGTIDDALTMSIERKSDGKMQSIVHLDRSSNEIFVKEWKKYNPGQTDNEALLQNIYDSSHSFHSLKRFQPIETVFLWGDRTLEFSSLEIQFEKNEHGNFAYSKDPSLFLSKVQSPPKALPLFSSYLRLEKEDGTVKYLIPKNKFSPSSIQGGALNRSATIDLNTSEFLEITEKNGKLIGKTPEENLFLAGIHLAHKNYNAAYGYLSQTLSGAPQGYSEKENKIFTWINTLINIAKDSSPEATAIALRLTYLEIRNGLKNQSESQKDVMVDKAMFLLEKYHSVARHTKLYPLSKREELELLSFCKDESPSITSNETFENLNRIASLRKQKPAPTVRNFQVASSHVPPNPSTDTIFAHYGIALTENLAKPENQAEQEKLTQIFEPQKTSSKLETRELRRVQNSLTVHHKQKLEEKIYEMDDSQLENISGVFRSEAYQLRIQAEKKKSEILSLANKRSNLAPEAMVQDLKEASNVKKNLTIDDLLILFLQNNGAGLSKRNPSLTAEEMTKLGNLLTDYLIYETERDHLLRAKDFADKALNEESPIHKEKYLQSLSVTLHEKRQYSPLKEPVMLIFEYHRGFRLREAQAATIRSMVLDGHGKSKNNVHQLIMGSGKSKVILPLLAYLNSSGKNIPIICVPKSLYETSLHDMRISSGELLHQPVETLSFAEGEPFTALKCDEILQKFQTVKEDRSYLLLSDDTLKTLYLHCKSILVELADCQKQGLTISNDLKERYGKTKEILQSLKDEGDLIIDEIDMVLQCLNEMNFSSGERSPILESTQNNLQNIFTEINSDEKLKTFFSLDHETEKLFDQKVYNEKIKPKLVSILLDETKFEILKGMSPSEKENAKKYLDSDPTFANWFQNQGAEVQGLLSLGKELINTLFPLILQKNSNEHYGLSKKDPSNRAIPYTKKNEPSEKSEFSSPYETLLYSMIYYTRNGVSEQQMKRLITDLKAKALAEHKSKKTPLNKTQAYQKFQGLNLTTKDLFTIQDSEIAAALSTFNKEFNNRIQFARSYAWNEVGVYSERISCTSQDPIGMCRSTQGFAGTFNNKDTFHHSLNPIPEVATDGKTISLLYEMKPEVKSFSNLDALYQSLPKYDACIDSGNWFRGVDAIDAAKKINSLLPKGKKGVVYLNDKDQPPGMEGQIVFLEKGKEKPVLLSDIRLKPEERFTYYNVTTGVDITQHDLARAIVTVSKTESLRDSLQGVWRMRGLEYKQTVDFALPTELAKDLGEETFDAIFQLHCQVQADAQKQENPHSLKQKFSHAVESLVEAVCWHADASIEEIAAVASDSRAILAKALSQDPSMLFGDIMTDEKMSESVSFSIAKCLNDIKPLYEKYPHHFEKIMSFEDLEKELLSLVEYDALPEKDKMPSTSDAQNMENQYGISLKVTQKVTQKTKTQTQVNVVTDTYNSSSGVRNITPWKNIEIFSNRCWEGEKGPQCQIVNNYLQTQSHLLNDISEVNCFSDRLLASKNFLPNINRVSIPFQSGSKPLIGTAALRIDPTGKLSLTFLHPIEIELLGKILESDGANFDEIEARKKNMAYKLIIDFIQLHISNFNLSDEENERLFLNFNVERPFALYNEILTKLKFPPELMNKKAEIVENLQEELRRNEMDTTGLADSETSSIELYHLKNILNSKRDFELLLVNPEIGIVQQGKNKIDEIELQQNPQYIELMAQAKFYNGTLDNYTEDEKEYLKKWISENGLEKMQNLLLNNILRVKEDSANRYPESVLKQIFDSVENPENQ